MSLTLWNGSVECRKGDRVAVHGALVRPDRPGSFYAKAAVPVLPAAQTGRHRGQRG